MSDSPRFVISTIGLNRREGTKQCIEAVLKHGKDFHLILTDNGSSDGTGPMMDSFAKKHKNVDVIHNPENRGFQDPHALAFRMAARMGAEFFLCLNDDTLPPAGFLEKLVAPFFDPTVALTGVAGTCCSLNHDFHGGTEGQPEYVDGACLMIRIETIRRLRRNLWCPGLRGIYGEDSSISLFIQERGYKIALVQMTLPHARSSTVNSDPAIKRFCNEAQEHNHQVNKKRWAYYLDHRRFDLPIIVKREYAIGDVILVEPIIRAIRKSRPLSPIFVQTRFPELFTNHPDVDQAAEKIKPPTNALVVDLDGAYEHTVNTHICEAYWQAAAKVITGLEPLELTTRLYPSPNDVAWAKEQVAKIGPNIALVATDNTTWMSKNWPRDRMQAVAKWLVAEGWNVVAVGSKDRHVASDFPGVTNLVGKTSLMELAALCGLAKLVVAPDTSTIHIAQAMGCPVVPLFGITRSRFITTQGSKCAAVECPESMEHAGVRHRMTGKTVVDVGTACMDAITVEQVVEGVKKLSV